MRKIHAQWAPFGRGQTQTETHPFVAEANWGLPRTDRSMRDRKGGVWSLSRKLGREEQRSTLARRRAQASSDTWLYVPVLNGRGMEPDLLDATTFPPSLKSGACMPNRLSRIIPDSNRPETKALTMDCQGEPSLRQIRTGAPRIPASVSIATQPDRGASFVIRGKVLPGNLGHQLRGRRVGILRRGLLGGEVSSMGRGSGLPDGDQPGRCVLEY
jgi:hypothetical protein